MPEIYATSDIWLGALFLSENDAELVDIQVSRAGRETVSFAFRGPNLAQLANSYCQHQALANVVQLREKINVLRDLIFQAKAN